MLTDRFRHTLRRWPTLRRIARWLQTTSRCASERMWWELSKPPYPSKQDMRLHLGCGDIDFPGFVNIDARPRSYVHHVRDVSDLRIFRNDSVDLIYASHCLEHVPHRKLLDTLAEWHRVLRPKGTLRLSVPDFDLLLSIYAASDRDMTSILLPLMGHQDHHYNFHYTCFNAGSLTQLLYEAGFQEVRQWIVGTEPFTSIPDWSARTIEFNGRRFPVSLNLEGIK
jgi:predicted SAM-dependent methyltransferase